MALNEIFKGMENGAEAIDQNFKQFGTSQQYFSGKVQLKGGFTGDIFVARSGNVVSIYGWVNNANELASMSETTVLTLPVGYRPSSWTTLRQQGSYTHSFLETINTNGDLTISRYTDTKFGKNTWINLFATFITKDEYPA
ncbi:hypothetical protein [Leuconostoc citreum]|uniref:hypothetical protein n=1 Tax=Leuconostoc citreum TaxID=33964 RepID=UPI0032DF875B